MKDIVGVSHIKYELDNLKEIPHILFSGPRGAGKTTLAQYIADKSKNKLIFTTGNTLKKHELLNVLINLNKGDILLVDEIHRLKPEVEEILYQPMELYKLPMRDLTGRFQTFALPQFTVIGTTTKPSLLSKPLISRFRITFQIPHYNLRELSRIITHEYKISKRDSLKVALNVVTPREALNLTYRILQLGNDIEKNLQFIGYKFGLNKSERFYLKIVYNVGNISLSSLTSALQLDEDEVKYIEDKLLQKRYIQITNKGRVLTPTGLIKMKEILGDK